MLFNSVEFLLFFPVCLIIYWLLRSIRAQNIFLLLASYFFYAWWDYRFLSLIIFSSAVDWYCGLKIDSLPDKSQKRLWLGLSLLTNFGILAFFKYYNFFIPEFARLMNEIGFNTHWSSLQIILPVGISFYTFQTVSYSIDIYRGQLKPSRKIIDFFSFVSFFPQLVAGPIERASQLLPQFSKKRTLTNADIKFALRKILFGLFKKVALADACAVNVDLIYKNHEHLHSVFILIGIILFAFQIYGDFSGYSDIAIGTARLFGFRLMENFNRPYFSYSIAEFWARWHISLSTWFRDYLYIPLGGNRKGKMNQIRNIMIVFTVSGLWHGANWTFLFWGFLNGLFFLPSLYQNKNNKLSPIFIPITFALVCFTWIFFRSQTITEAFSIIEHLFSFETSFSLLHTKAFLDGKLLLISCVFISMLLVIEGVHFFEKRIQLLPVYLRWISYYLLLVGILYCWSLERNFIYFQF